MNCICLSRAKNWNDCLGLDFSFKLLNVNIVNRKVPFIWQNKYISFSLSLAVYYSFSFETVTNIATVKRHCDRMHLI